MNIAILSMQRILNYGSLLQAYSLRKMLENLGHNVSFIDIESNTSENNLLDSTKIIRFQEETNYTTNNAIENTIETINNKLVWFRQKQQFLKFQRNTLKLNNSNNLRSYDCCVIGSDEVFNCLQPSRWGFTSQLFGNIPQSKEVITYAASCGYTAAKDVPHEVGNVIRESLSRIKAFSVRDNNTYDFVRNFSDNNNVFFHLDPVAVGDFSQEIGNKKIKNKLPEHYCLIYAYSGRLNDNASVSAIKSFCNKNGLTPISVGGLHKWISKHPYLDPFEVLIAFKNADFVITDTFHGAIFSAKYSDRFAVITRPSNQNKLNDLVQRLKIERHLLHNINDISKLFMIEKNTELINSILNYEQERSIDYLENNL